MIKIICIFYAIETFHVKIPGSGCDMKKWNGKGMHLIDYQIQKKLMYYISKMENI